MSRFVTATTDPIYGRRPGDVLIENQTGHEYVVTEVGADEVGAVFYRVRETRLPADHHAFIEPKGPEGWAPALRFQRN